MNTKFLPLAFVVLLCVVCAGPLRGQTAGEKSPAAQTEHQTEGDKKPREFKGDDLPQVLSLLARQAKIDLIFDDTIKGSVNLRMENATAMETLEAIVRHFKFQMSKDEKGVHHLVAPDQAVAALEFVAKPETAAKVAAYDRNLFVALTKEGFSDEEALQIVTASDPNAIISALAKKPEAGASK